MASKRKTEDEQFDATRLNEMKGTPWGPVPGKNYEEIPARIKPRDGEENNAQVRTHVCVSIFM